MSKRATASSAVELLRRSPALVKLMRLFESFAASLIRFPVLILGERGIGKTTLARMMYEHAGMSGEFVEINAAGLQHDLAVSQLFGHERGAFSGAITQYRGAFERANRGMLFLDELAHLDLRAQALLLTAIENGRFERLGGDRSVQVRVKFVTATNADPERLVRKKRLLPDLYGRMKTFALTVPPLRERRDELLGFANHFLADIARQDGKHRSYVLTTDAEALLLAAPWYDNLRELRDACLFATILADGPVLWAEHFPGVLPSLDHAAPTVERNERDQKAAELRAALLATGGNKAMAARRLNWHLSTVKRLAKELETEDASSTRRKTKAAAS